MDLRAAARALTGLFLGSALALGQQQAVDFRADVELVLLHVAIIDPGGGQVPPLSVEDFKVFDDEQEQHIELFLTPTDAPLDVGLVLDSSTSMQAVARVARRSALTFLNSMAVDDCVYALPFSDRVGPGRWGRASDPRLHAFVNSVRPGGGTALFDALLGGLSTLERADSRVLVQIASDAEGSREDEDEAPAGDEEADPDPPRATTADGAQGPDVARKGGPPVDLPPRRPALRAEVGLAVRHLDLKAPPPVTGCGEALPPGTPINPGNARRRALIVLSDGADLDSRGTFYDALGAARAASVPVFPVALGYANDEPGLKDRLGELARATGGRLIESAAPGRLEASYHEVVMLLRSYYLIGYDPDFAASESVLSADARPRWHDVSVELRRPNFQPLVRPGYYR